MVSELDYAALSACVYNDKRGDGNVLFTPPVGRSSVATPTNPSGGFTAEAYRKGNDIVIALNK